MLLTQREAEEQVCLVLRPLLFEQPTIREPRKETQERVLSTLSVNGITFTEDPHERENSGMVLWYTMHGDKAVLSKISFRGSFRGLRDHRGETSPRHCFEGDVVVS